MPRFSTQTFLNPTLLAIVLLFATLISAHGQTAPATGANQKAAPEEVVDPFGRSTPRGAIEGYLSAVGSDNLEKAARFLDVSDQPLGDRKMIALERAKQLKTALDRDGNIFDVSLLADIPAGLTNDGQDVNVDQVGELDRSERKVPLLVERVDGGDSGKIWLISQSTVHRLPFLVRVTKEPLLDRIMPDRVNALKIGSVSLAHWLAIGIVAILALLVGHLMSKILIGLLRRALKNKSNIPGHGALTAMVVPLGVLIGISLYRLAILNLGVDVVARENIDRFAGILGWMALAWLGLRFIDGAAAVAQFGMGHTRGISSVAVIMLAKRLAKAAILVIATIAILDYVGVDVTTGLAALGIGGLALALGAQKTIENLVGSITVVADKPVRVGDFCRFGDVSGTVEDIGIRSTQVRTLDRTIVTVPNGAFAAMQIENYAVRDEIKFETDLSMRYETTPDQMRYLLVEIRSLLYSHEKVGNNPARVRFIALGSHSLDIKIYCYIQTKVYEEFLEVQEDLLLRIMDIVKSSGTDFAFPSQTLYLGKDNVPTEANAKKISKMVQKLSKDGELHLPRFAPEKIDELDGTVKFPTG